MIYFIYLFLVFEYTKMSFIYIFAKPFKYDCNILLTIFCIVTGAFVNPNGMTKYSYIPYFVLNAVFHSFFYLTLIKLNASRKSKIMKYCTSLNFVFISVINGNGYLFLTVTAFMLRPQFRQGRFAAERLPGFELGSLGKRSGTFQDVSNVFDVPFHIYMSLFRKYTAFF